MHNNNAIWKDTHGQPIQAHGGGVLRVDDTWYWYGENKSGPTRTHRSADGSEVSRVDFIGVAGYRSKDLLNWEPMGNVLKADNNIRNYDLSATEVVERPKVVLHRESGTFVMWMHVDRPDYKLAATGVAISDRPEGPFRYLGSIRPQGRDSRDQTVFIDDEGAGYHICSTDMNEHTLVTRLSDDYRSLTGESKILFPGRHMEAHAIAKVDGRYWFIASGCTGWNPNTARSAVADQVWGPWEELDNPCVDGEQPGLTWGAQSTFLLALPGGGAVAMFDRWKPDALAESGYTWVNAEITDQRIILPWQDTWSGIVNGRLYTRDTKV